VPLDLLPEHASVISSVAGEPVVLVCRSGARARQAAQSLGTVELR
jgi:rhodanese-related sulfurtransferase